VAGGGISVDVQRVPVKLPPQTAYGMTISSTATVAAAARLGHLCPREGLHRLFGHERNHRRTRSFMDAAVCTSSSGYGGGCRRQCEFQFRRADTSFSLDQGNAQTELGADSNLSSQCDCRVRPHGHTRRAARLSVRQSPDTRLNPSILRRWRIGDSNQLSSTVSRWR